MSKMGNREIVLSFALRLYEAIEENNLEVAEDLIKRKGANPNIILPDNGISCFHLAVGIDSVDFSEEVTRLFLRYGGNPNVRSCEGLTPVHVAAIRGRLQNLRLLLLAGGDPQTIDEDGCSPMYYAHQEGHISCVELLQNYKCIYTKHFIPISSPYNSNEAKICPENTNNFDDLLFEENCGAQVCKFSEVSSVDETNLENFNPHSTRWKSEDKLNEGKLNGVCLNNFFAVLVTKENKHIGQEEELVELPKDQSKFNPAASSSCVSCQSDSHKFESWLASHSCFTETIELESNFEGKLRTDESYIIEGKIVNLSSKIDDESKTLGNVCEKDYSEQEKNENIIVGERIYDESFKINDETFSKHNDSSCSPLTHRTYGILDCAHDTLLTLDVSEHSIISSDRSYPIQGILNTSSQNNYLTDLSKARRSYSESKLSDIGNSFREKTKYVTYRRNGWLNITLGETSISSTSCSESEEYFTVPDEICEHTDEERLVLLEKRLPSVLYPGIMISGNAQNERFSNEDSVVRTSSACSLSTCDTEDLRKEVHRAVSHGCCCPLGPITATTKRVYLQKIYKFKKGMMNKNPQSSSQPIPVAPKFSRELERTLAKPVFLSNSKYVEIEQRMMTQFDGNGKFSQWREGGQKSSFNYLLLDPRLTDNLPLRWANDVTRNKSFDGDANSHYWRDFLCAVFYVGKGKRSRPYSHLYEAITSWRGGTNVKKVTKKVKHILEIWKENLGVICLHVFQNSIPVEAFTREAAMIDAIGLNNLKNERRGDYYGVISSLGFSQKREFGAFLLYRAMLIFLNEGERQMKPSDID